MRERWARILAVITGLILVSLAGVFTEYQRRAREGSPAQIDRGQLLFAEMQCASCHSIRGHGSPRYPLDAVAQSLDPAVLRLRALGQDPTAPVAPRILRRKSENQARAQADFDALLAFLHARDDADAH